MVYDGIAGTDHCMVLVETAQCLPLIVLCCNTILLNKIDSLWHNSLILSIHEVQRAIRSCKIVLHCSLNPQGL